MNRWKLRLSGAADARGFPQARASRRAWGYVCSAPPGRSRDESARRRALKGRRLPSAGFQPYVNGQKRMRPVGTRLRSCMGAETSTSPPRERADVARRKFASGKPCVAGTKAGMPSPPNARKHQAPKGARLLSAGFQPYVNGQKHMRPAGTRLRERAWERRRPRLRRGNARTPRGGSSRAGNRAPRERRQECLRPQMFGNAKP